jgi:hypothetical protein
MNETTRKLLTEAVSRHEACVRELSGVRGRGEVVRRLVEIEHASWSETPLEAENRPMTYRHLLSLVDDLPLLEQRYAACEHLYLRSIIAQRYWEVLGGVSDMAKLMELAIQAHPGLRDFAVLRFQEHLPDALRKIAATDIPKWFIRLLMQPWEMANFLSQESCKAVIEKTRALVAARTRTAA